MHQAALRHRVREYRAQAVGQPRHAVHAHEQHVSTPRWRSSSNTPIQWCAPSVSRIHSPSTSLRPARSWRLARRPPCCARAPAPHRHVEAVDEHERVHGLQRARAPPPSSSHTLSVMAETVSALIEKPYISRTVAAMSR